MSTECALDIWKDSCLALTWTFIVTWPVDISSPVSELSAFSTRFMNSLRSLTSKTVLKTCSWLFLPSSVTKQFSLLLSPNYLTANIFSPWLSHWRSIQSAYDRKSEHFVQSSMKVFLWSAILLGEYVLQQSSVNPYISTLLTAPFQYFWDSATDTPQKSKLVSELWSCKVSLVSNISFSKRNFV